MKRLKYTAEIEGLALQSFQDGLLDWYRDHGRELPWRRRREPYAVIVSEIMLHQTTVATVTPVFERFLQRYPTLQALYEAPLPEVKAITDPLGYKVRGKWLKDIATYVVEECSGHWPTTVEGWMELPGVGRYTAGAVLSLAFGQDVPILDTNVKRVLGRFFGLPFSQPGADVSHRLWALAEAVIPSGQGRDFNQALMDFGAMVCTARKPACTICPLINHCAFEAEPAAAVAEESAVYRINLRDKAPTQA